MTLMNAQIVFIDANSRETTVAFDAVKNILTVGRSGDCDLVINSSFVSGRHNCFFTQQN